MRKNIHRLDRSMTSQCAKEEEMTEFGKGDSEWFTHARFGMFIHWGLYSMPARHEWVRNREEITNEDYQKYFDHFDPDLFEDRKSVV